LSIVTICIAHISKKFSLQYLEKSGKLKDTSLRIYTQTPPFQKVLHEKQDPNTWLYIPTKCTSSLDI
jgi:hypothetical protein